MDIEIEDRSRYISAHSASVPHLSAINRLACPGPADAQFPRTTLGSSPPPSRRCVRARWGWRSFPGRVVVGSGPSRTTSSIDRGLRAQQNRAPCSTPGCQVEMTTFLTAQWEHLLRLEVRSVAETGSVALHNQHVGAPRFGQPPRDCHPDGLKPSAVPYESLREGGSGPPCIACMTL